jgi:hypothetical protein
VKCCICNQEADWSHKCTPEADQRFERIAKAAERILDGEPERTFSDKLDEAAALRGEGDDG